MGLQDFFQLNMLPVGIVFFMLIIVIANKNYERDIVRMFLTPIILLMMVIIEDNIDYAMIQQQDASIWHVLAATIGYNCRIVILISLLYIVLRNSEYKYKFLLKIPGVICIFITSLSLFTKFVFWYDENTGEMIRGPFAFAPHVTLMFYVLILLYVGVKRIFQRKIEEGIIIVFGCILNCVATLVEYLYRLRGILMGSIALVLVFYFLYLHVQIFKTDVLTGCFNRLTMKSDSKKFKNSIRTILMIDLNNLKAINDIHGHEAGDTALKTLAYNVRRNLPNGCILYRTGGDEFVVFILRSVTKTTDEIINKLKSAMKKTNYEWAIGYYEFESPKDYDLNKALSIADARMYINKKQMKENNIAKDIIV